MKLTAEQQKILSLLAIYGFEVNLMIEDGLSISHKEAQETLEMAVKVLQEQMSPEGLPKVPQGIVFSFDSDDEGYRHLPEMTETSWSVYLFHDEHDLMRSDGLERLVPVQTLRALGISGDVMENCYGVLGETRREIKDRLESVGCVHDRPSWETDQFLDQPASFPEQWEIDLYK